MNLRIITKAGNFLTSLVMDF